MKQQLNFSIEAEQVEQLETLAARKHRSKSNMLEMLIIEAFAIDNVIGIASDEMINGTTDAQK